MSWTSERILNCNTKGNVEWLATNQKKKKKRERERTRNYCSDFCLPLICLLRSFFSSGCFFHSYHYHHIIYSLTRLLKKTRKRNGVANQRNGRSGVESKFEDVDKPTYICSLWILITQAVFKRFISDQDELFAMLHHFVSVKLNGRAMLFHHY